MKLGHQKIAISNKHAFVQSRDGIGRVEKLRNSLGLGFGKLLKPHVLISCISVVFLAVIWTITFNLIYLERSTAVTRARESSLKLVEIYEAQVASNLSSIDQVLGTVTYADNLKGSHRALVDLRAKGLLPPSFIFTISITDNFGNIIASTGRSQVGSITSQPFFLEHQRSDNQTTLVGSSVSANGEANALMHFSRRLNNPNGAFKGIVLLSVTPGYFTSGYEESRLGKHGALALLRDDGDPLVIRVGDELSSPRNLRPVPIEGELLMPSPWDGVQRFANTRLINGFPLAVTVGLSEAEQLTDFNRSKTTRLWVAGAASTLLLVVTTALGFLLQQLARNRAYTRKAQDRYYTASDASLDAFYVLTSIKNASGKIEDFVVTDTNREGARLFGTTKDGIVGQTLCRAFPQSATSGVLDAYIEVTQTGNAHEQEWEYHTSSGKITWLYRQVVRIEDGVFVILRDITERKRAELLKISQGQLLEMIAKGTPLKETLQRLMDLLESQLPGLICSVLLLDKNGVQLRHAASCNLAEGYIQAIDGISVGPNVGSCGTAVFRRQTIIVNDIASDPLWSDFRQLAAVHGLRACWSKPILAQQNNILGTFAVYYTEPRTPDTREVELVDMATQLAEIAIERHHNEDRIRYLAHHDALTGLPNRSLLEDRIKQAILYAQRYDRHATVVFIDLDNFKLINDSLGHTAGDELLKTVAHRMTESVRKTDTVVRLGGDEFVIILFDQSKNADAVIQTLQKLLDAVGKPIHVNQQELQVTCSMGLATYPVDGSDTETLLMNADAAMYRAKAIGRNNYQFYAAEMNTEVHEKFAMQEGLRTALIRNQFFLAYQPQVDLPTGRIFGVEALIRWQHPERGLIPPAQFISVAEESGLIAPIGDWVLNTACRQNKAWQDAGFSPIVMAVNVSARQFKDGYIVKKVAQALEETGLEARYLELELTESLIMQNVSQAISTMQQLQTMGVQLSIDDFGTGYSSLSSLKSFPITRLKVDRSFVQNLPNDSDDAVIAAAVISLGHELGLKVLAEGVENEEQLAFLRNNNCDEMQGYYFSKPVSSQEVEELFRNS